MGGSIAMGVRFKSGETIVQERWTNNVPYWVKRSEWFTGDEAYVRSYFAMETDGEPNIPLTPVEYGIIFTDYMTNMIISHNHYTSIDHFHGSHFSLMHPNKNGHIALELEDDEKIGYQRLIDENRLTERRFRTIEHDNTYEHLVIDETPITGTLEDFVVHCYEQGQKEYRKDAKIYSWYMLDPRPMTLIQFSEHDDPMFEKTKAELLKLGLPVDEAAWKEFDKRYDEEDD